MDGYSTSLEQEGDVEDEDDSETDELDESFANCPSVGQERQDNVREIEDIPPGNTPQQEDSSVSGAVTVAQDREESRPTENADLSEKERIFKKERQRYFELSMCQSLFVYKEQTP